MVAWSAGFGMGKCKFDSRWLDDSRFASWLKPAEGNEREAHCTFCRRNIKLCKMGVRAVDSHMMSEKHKAAAKIQAQISALSRAAKMNPDPSEDLPVPLATPDPAKGEPTEQSRDLNCDGMTLRGPNRSNLKKENLVSGDKMAHDMSVLTPGGKEGDREEEAEPLHSSPGFEFEMAGGGEQTMDCDDEKTTISSNPSTTYTPSSSSNHLEPIPDDSLLESKPVHNSASSRPPPRTTSISSDLPSSANLEPSVLYSSLATSHPSSPLTSHFTHCTTNGTTSDPEATSLTLPPSSYPGPTTSSSTTLPSWSASSSLLHPNPVLDSSLVVSHPSSSPTSYSSPFTTYSANGITSDPMAASSSQRPPFSYPSTTDPPSCSISSSRHTPPVTFDSQLSSSLPPPNHPSSVTFDPCPLPRGASSVRAQDHMPQMAFQSLQQQQATRRLLESASESLDSLTQSVHLLVQTQQEYVQESLMLQKETADILKDFSITALAILREKPSQRYTAGNTLSERCFSHTDLKW